MTCKAQVSRDLYFLRPRFGESSAEPMSAAVLRCPAEDGSRTRKSELD